MIPLKIAITKPSRSWRRPRRSLPPLATPSIAGMIMPMLKPGDTFVDVGASNGVALTFAAAVAVGPLGRVLALEPDPVRFTRLQENVTANALGNVYCLPIAASDESICAAFVCELPRIGLQIATRRSSIRVQRVDTLCRRLASQGRTIVRINAPGSELLVLRGMTDLFNSDTPPTVFCQISRWGQASLKASRGELLSFMAEQGYDCDQIGPTVISRFESRYPQVRMNMRFIKQTPPAHALEIEQEQVACHA